MARLYTLTPKHHPIQLNAIRLMKHSLKKIQIDRSSAVVTAKRISRDELLTAILDYINLIENHKFKIGDLLNEFRERYPEEIQDYCVNNLEKKTSYRKPTLAIMMSLSKAFPPRERSDLLSPTHYHTLQSLQVRNERRRNLEWAKTKVSSGESLSDIELRKIVRQAKIETGQGISKRGNARKKNRRIMPRSA